MFYVGIYVLFKDTLGTCILLLPGALTFSPKCCIFHHNQREKKRWAFRKSKYFSMEATFLDSDPSSGGSGSRKKIAKGTVLKSRLHQLNGLPVAKESDFDSASGSLVPLKGVAKKASSKALGVSDTDDVYPLVLGEFSMRKALTWLTGMYDNLDKKHDFVPPQGQEQPKYVVTNVDEKRLSRQPPLPFITSSLQQEASRRLGLSPSRTMSVAQELYENGFITYMRTDSPKLSETASRTAKEKVVSFLVKNISQRTATRGTTQ
jgi:DNA topoisomerase IA